MSTDVSTNQRERLIDDLYATDPQLAAARPNPAIASAINEPGRRLPDIVRTVMEGYRERPALGSRAVEFTTDPGTGRTQLHLLPRFETTTYGELWTRVLAATAALADGSVHPGDRLALLGFTSVDYTTLDLAVMQLGAICVPLQTSAPVASMLPVVVESEPTVIGAHIDFLAEAVELAAGGHPPRSLIVFDYRPEVDDQREAFESAKARLEPGVAVESLADLIGRGRQLPTPPALVADSDDPVTLLVYTSGSTGTPKGAMYTEHLTANFWQRAVRPDGQGPAAVPSITLNYMPMSHMMGRGFLYQTLSSGGTAYFAAKSDLSTFLEDLTLVRPTRLSCVPRIWDMLMQEFRTEVQRRSRGGIDQSVSEAEAEADVIADQRRTVLGGRVVEAITGSAPMTPEMWSFVESYIGSRPLDTYGTTEAGGIMAGGRVSRPPVVEYRLADVPELGYYATDRPHPRGELLVKSDDMFAGYYRRPEVTQEMFDADGFYRTGDIMAEVAPDELVYLDRRNNVLKLAQGEFVAISKLEAVFTGSPELRQIYVYGNSARSYLVAVAVPTDDAVTRCAGDVERLRSLIGGSLQRVARETGLQSYEIPRAVLVETTPFTLENGLLTGVRKLARPKLKERYGDLLEQLYTDLDAGQADELRALRDGSDSRPVLDTVSRAAAALLGAATADVAPDQHFTNLGGDSLSALTFSRELHEIFGVDVPVGVIVSPAADLRAIADYVEAQQSGDSVRPTFDSVHGSGATTVAARDLTLDKFLDADLLAAAPALPSSDPEPRTVLLTGATGFLGRYLALEWLERMSRVDGKLICVVRGKDDATARARLDATFDVGDPHQLRHYRELAADHLEVLAGDKGELNLGLDTATWQRLADTVDLIVDPAALVNHVLPYRELFGPNALGTAELIRIALTTTRKPICHVSTIGVADQIAPADFVEDADIREISASRSVNDGYANGYANSKWAGEVLLRQANELCGLPVAVFRCDMILADTTYSGQLNLPDVFTRLMLSLILSGIAPDSFYETTADGGRPRAHYDGLPVGFIAEAISTIGGHDVDGFHTYHVMNPHDDGIGLDQFVDWLIEAGHPIQRIPEYSKWFQRIEAVCRALPDRQRQYSLLPLLQAYERPADPVNGSSAPTDRFRAAVQAAKIGTDKDIPHLTPAIIEQYATNLGMAGLVDPALGS